MNISRWAENITKEIYLEYKKKYSFWKPGLKVFYSPVIVNPDLVIISYQPGGTEKHFSEEDKESFENGDFGPQKFNSYSETNHLMSRKIRGLFSDNAELLKNSVVFPLIFFRAPTILAWRKDIPKETRIEMENFCFSKVKEVLEKLRPKNILVLGMETYNRLKDILGSVENEKILYKHSGNSARMAVAADCGGYKTLAIIHPSGARISKADWNLLRRLFQQEIKKSTD